MMCKISPCLVRFCAPSMLLWTVEDHHDCLHSVAVPWQVSPLQRTFPPASPSARETRFCSFFCGTFVQESSNVTLTSVRTKTTISFLSDGKHISNELTAVTPSAVKTRGVTALEQDIHCGLKKLSCSLSTLSAAELRKVQCEE